jgi:ribonuclease HI
MKERINMRVKMFTDGAARGNPDGPGGYGVVLQYTDTKGNLHEKELSEGYEKTTNNRMELMGVIAGLEALNRPCEVDVFSDSQYVIKAFQDGWLDSWQKKAGKSRTGNRSSMLISGSGFLQRRSLMR